MTHDRAGGFVSQREVRGGSADMLTAARLALREDPDVLVLDEVRSRELMDVALDAAARGHLVIGGFPAAPSTASSIFIRLTVANRCSRRWRRTCAA